MYLYTMRMRWQMRTGTMCWMAWLYLEGYFDDLHREWDRQDEVDQAKADTAGRCSLTLTNPRSLSKMPPAWLP